VLGPSRFKDNGAMEKIERDFKTVMGADCQLTWQFHDKIPALDSGKYLYIRSLVS
jgi:hypothetical protein